MIKATIKVQNEVQKVLLDSELLGQFSDGYWENSRNQSWDYLGKVQIANDSDNTGVVFEDFVPCDYKAYSVNNKTLLEYVGDRMLVKARVSNYLRISDLSSIECLLEYACSQKVSKNVEVKEEDIIKLISEWQKDSSKFWNKEAEKSIAFIKNTGLQNLLQAINSDYKMSNMRKELNSITKILKNTRTKEIA